ncbi:hypothetical protein ACIBSV_12100 [Embleya sp. NPDC050154]|uniref:hypothetical protein n=1 Tax=Embleya sp. NPDC050154 TaxID=3363988 RepID=UPI0037B4CACB
MAATTGGAIKAHLEAAGLGIRVYRDGPAPGTALPYIAVTEGISLVPSVAARGDVGDQAADIAVVEQVQVDIIQQARTVAGQNAERYDLPAAVYRALDGARLTAHPTHVYGSRVLSMGRDAIVDNVVRHILMVQLDRDLLPAT